MGVERDSVFKIKIGKKEAAVPKEKEFGIGDIREEEIIINKKASQGKDKGYTQDPSLLNGAEFFTFKKFDQSENKQRKEKVIKHLKGKGPQGTILSIGRKPISPVGDRRLQKK